VAFAIFTLALMILSAQANLALFLVFLALGARPDHPGHRQVLGQHRHDQTRRVRGRREPLLAWYLATAGIAAGMGGRVKLPVGRPLIRPL